MDLILSCGYFECQRIAYGFEGVPQSPFPMLNVLSLEVIRRHDFLKYCNIEIISIAQLIAFVYGGGKALSCPFFQQPNINIWFGPGKQNIYLSSPLSPNRLQMTSMILGTVLFLLFKKFLIFGSREWKMKKQSGIAGKALSYKPGD